jgi:hypothetical protein
MLFVIIYKMSYECSDIYIVNKKDTNCTIAHCVGIQKLYEFLTNTGIGGHNLKDICTDINDITICKGLYFNFKIVSVNDIFEMYKKYITAKKELEKELEKYDKINYDIEDDCSCGGFGCHCGPYKKTFYTNKKTNITINNTVRDEAIYKLKREIENLEYKL